MTLIPDGADGVCGRMPSFVATTFVDSLWMSSPSSRTVPCLGLSRRASARSRVDFPQALAPTMAVIFPDGIVTDSALLTSRLS